MNTTLKLVFLFFTFCILFVLPSVLIPLRVKMESQSEYNGLMAFLLLLTLFSVVIYLINRLNLSGVKLFLSVVIVFWGLQTFMTQIETWYFIDAMPAITNSELRNLFLRPLITSITFVPLAMWVLDRWKHKETDSESSMSRDLNWKIIALLSLAYVVIYFTFGYFVAWQFEAVRVFYSGSPEDTGFIGGLQHSWQTDRLIFPFQVFR